MDVASVVQEQVVLDEGGKVQFGNHLVDSGLQKGPESAASQVLQGARRHRQGEDRLIEFLVLLMEHKCTNKLISRNNN